MLNLIRLVISLGIQINVNQDLLVKSEVVGLDWLDTQNYEGIWLTPSSLSVD